MDYPLSSDNPLCRLIGHWFKPYRDYTGEPHKTCNLCGLTIPPFPKVPQERTKP